MTQPPSRRRKLKHYDGIPTTLRSPEDLPTRYPSSVSFRISFEPYGLRNTPYQSLLEFYKGTNGQLPGIRTTTADFSPTGFFDFRAPPQRELIESLPTLGATLASLFPGFEILDMYCWNLSATWYESQDDLAFFEAVVLFIESISTSNVGFDWGASVLSEQRSLFLRRVRKKITGTVAQGEVKEVSDRKQAPWCVFASEAPM
ncbi:hypothetical protein M427DRAFT_54872 [Gonapodya prolifera JEL478]|uniref:Uncharacterized protein n=1 Tax=Gonapodya prolifera (strain JEL478) TaxID=1344416 RepID=A0A139ALD0_GONPJ|nr:hypothetical protein M427DRAFT_54872 [Gonapodya prolifera JEL478]|eukprot:KXS17225.1 hypothetical protein M427DRAFT_54872 [Gonapodya prolifera JEL478]